LKWAIQDHNNATESAEKQHTRKTGAAKGAADRRNSGFAEAIQAILSLPLSDAEKADAVRRLLKEKHHD
jgi:hypothetical protein